MKKALSLLASAIALTGVATMAIAAEAPLTLEELSEKVIAQEKKIRELEAGQEATVEALEQGGANGNSLLAWAEKTKIGGYGEHHYNNFQGGDEDQIDAHRFVIYISHEYSDIVRFFSEVELEHSLAGDGKPGEVELEQAYIEWDFADNHRVQFGQFLVPVGILNETHEPDTFYGVERNLVESEVIPSTWWESGIMFIGEVAPGLSYNAAIHSGLEVPTTGSSRARIRSGRQKSAEAKAEDFAFTGRLKYTGIKGLELAATAQYQEDITQGAITGDTQSAVLLETHAIVNAGPFGLRALYAQWDIDSDTADTLGVDRLDGFFIEPSYKVTEKLGVFARYSEWERGDDIADANDPLVTAITEEPDFDSLDFGVNYWLNPNVVLKADYREFSDDAGNDSLSLGVGWSY